MRGLSRRGRVRLGTFVLLLILIPCVWAGQKQRQVRQLEYAMDLSYRHAFAELAAYMGEVDTALRKSCYAASPSLLTSLCAETYAKSMAAQMALGELPCSHVTLEQTADFIARTGDYSAMLARQTALQGGCTAEQREALYALSATATELTARLTALQAGLEDGAISPETLEQVQGRLAAPAGEGMGGNFQQVETEFPEVPSLIYDGPFSQHLERQTPRNLEGERALTAREARRAAAALWSLPEEMLILTGENAGKLPTWNFSGRAGERSWYLTVSQRGGQPVLLYVTRPMGECTLTPEEGAARAAQLLRDMGWPEMAESYHTARDGAVTVNFAAVQEDVICYPDLVKVTVALDDGSLLGFEAAGYQMNHTQRELPEIAVPAEEALAHVAPGLTVLSCQPALIPSSGLYELLCWELLCQAEDGTHVLLYVNAVTGTEEKLLILLEDETGTLTI